MGFLHEGHLTLVKRAREDCSSVVTSIFINPTQFGANEDLSAYPRDIPRDLDLLAESGVDLVWVPDRNEMYPPDFQTWIEVEHVTKPLEGFYRPGHFRGVTTIVAKLLNAIQPTRVYFGQKDAQQSVVIRQMVKDLNIPVEVIVCPTVREPDGLALSSRNVYLNPKERRAAPVLYQALVAAKEAFYRGERDAAELRRIMIEIIEQVDLANLQYVSCADIVSLQELEGRIETGLLSLAVVIGKTRLIDNIILGE
jgi:pantoate--beta-alanine ligase